MLRLKCVHQCYDWGKLGPESIVYKLLVASKAAEDLNSRSHFAELWMGTHKSGASVLWDEPAVTLEEHIKKNPATLGIPTVERFGHQLPFLFKVLSVGQALSIQAHPDKTLAVRLHAEQPDVYKDDNHKPEMAIALSDFEALLGFRPLSQILNFLKALPDLEKLTANSGAQQQSSVCSFRQSSCPSDGPSIKEIYSNLMRAPQEAVEATIRALVARFTLQQQQQQPIAGLEDAADLVELFLRLNHTYPGDVGCLSVFLLNYVTLRPGEAIFLEANTPHAYIHGDCVECMANSDNVVRAGLTPKFKDVERLLEMLDYSAPENLQSLRINPKEPLVPPPTGVSVQTFFPPVAEFAVQVIQFDREGRGYSLPPLPTASILIILRGSGSVKATEISPDACLQEMEFTPGFVFYVAAETTVNLVSEEVTGDTDVSLHACRAFVNRS